MFVSHPARPRGRGRIDATAMDITALPPNTVIEGYRIAGAPVSDGFTLAYPAVETATGAEVTLVEFAPADFALRAGTILEPRPHHDDDYDWAREAFESDARALIGVRHPHKLAVHGILRALGTTYRVEARPEGVTLATILARDSTITRRELLQVLHPLLDAVEEMHRKGVLHLGIDPRHIVIGPEGAPLLTGIGRGRRAYERRVVERFALSLGFEPYDPPEIYRVDTDAGPWSDVYSLAAVAHHALTGAPPQGEPKAGEPKADEGGDAAGAQLLATIGRALANEPRRRPHSIAEWRELIRGPGRRRR
jgi:serine/threonine protein kinase